VVRRKAATLKDAAETEGDRAAAIRWASLKRTRAYEWVTGKVPKWLATATSVLDLVRFLHCFQLVMAQAAEYARICHTGTQKSCSRSSCARAWSCARGVG
jgi:hypothetical protein